MNLISVDIQPGHYSHFPWSLVKVAKDLAEASDQIVWLFNGKDLGYNTKEAVIDWLVFDFNFSDELIERISFVEKSYGFFRDWIDMGVPLTKTKKAVKRLLSTGCHQSDELPEFKDLSQVYGSIYLPDDSVVDALRSVASPITMVGGGRDQCLLEIIILLEAMGKSFKLDSRAIYR